MEQTKEISVEVKLTSKDLVQLNLSYLYRSNSLATLLTVTFIILASWIYIISIQGYFTIPWVVWLWLIFMIFLPTATYIGAKKGYNNKFIQETKRYEINEEGIRFASESMTADIKWGDLIKVTTTKHAMYFFITNRAAQILPLGNVTEVQKNSLLSLVREKVVNKQKRFGFLKVIFFFLLIFIVTVVVSQYISAH